MNKRTKRNLTKELSEELDVFDDMLSALVEILEEKGLLTQEEWEQRIKNKLEERSKTISYRNIQFKET